MLYHFNGYLAIVAYLLCGFALAKYGLKPLSIPLMVYWLYLFLVTAPLSDPAPGVNRLVFWMLLIAIYHLPVDLTILQQSARLAGWLVFPLAIAWHWTNPNILSFSLWALLWLGLTIGSPWLFMGLAWLALALTDSQGALLATLTGAAFWWWYLTRNKWILAGLVTTMGAGWLLTIGAKLSSNNSFGNRMAIYQTAWQGILERPWSGHGVSTFEAIAQGQYYYEHHNLLLTVLWEGGLIGLALALWVGYVALTRHHWPGFGLAWLVTFLAHSMVDNPLFSTTALILFALLGGLPCKEKPISPWLWPGRLVWPFTRPQPG